MGASSSFNEFTSLDLHNVDDDDGDDDDDKDLYFAFLLKKLKYQYA